MSGDLHGGGSERRHGSIRGADAEAGASQLPGYFLRSLPHP